MKMIDFAITSKRDRSARAAITRPIRTLMVAPKASQRRLLRNATCVTRWVKTVTKLASPTNSMPLVSKKLAATVRMAGRTRK